MNETPADTAAEREREESIKKTHEAMEGFNENSSVLQVEQLAWPDDLLSDKAEKALNRFHSSSTLLELRRMADGSLEKLPPGIQRGFEEDPPGSVRIVAQVHYLAGACLEVNKDKMIGRLAEVVNKLAEEDFIVGHLDTCRLFRVPLVRPGGHMYACVPLIWPGMTLGMDTGERMVRFKEIAGRFDTAEGHIPFRVFPDEKAVCSWCNEEKLVTNFEFHLHNYFTRESPRPTDVMVCKECIALEFPGTEWKTPINVDGEYVCDLIVLKGQPTPEEFDRLKNGLREAMVGGDTVLNKFLIENSVRISRRSLYKRKAGE